MNAREDILGRVRAALHNAPAAPSGDRTAATSPPSVQDVLDLFAERVADYRAEVMRCSPPEVEHRIAERLRGASAVVPPDLPWNVAGSTTDDGLDARALDRLDAVVTAAAVGIALSGTIVLDHSAGQGRRVLSLIPDLHICVVDASQVVHRVSHAIALLNPSRPQTWISGPSATSDIELTRVEGVHGPRNLHVILVG